MNLHQKLQDLHWCIQAPSLVQLPELDGLPGLQSALSAQTQLPAADFQPAARLGLYYEQLWQHLTTEALGWTLVAANRQISASGRTLGALDLLHYIPATGTYRHTELAAKLYLCNGSGSELAHFIGPNAIDRLDIKLDRLTSHQLPLPNRPDAQATIDRWLKEQLLPPRSEANWESKMVLQGWLFYPKRGGAPRQIHPTINGDHLQGCWQYFQDCLNDTTHCEFWLILPRQYWLSPANISADDCLHSAQLPAWPLKRLHTPLLLNPTQLAACLSAHRAQEKPQPLLVAGVRLENNLWIEIERRMLVPDTWPQATGSGNSGAS